MIMNQAEIEMAVRAHHECPNVRQGVLFLFRLMQTINAQSDGWAYWKAPSKSAEKLMRLLQSAGDLSHGTQGRITEAALHKAISPIRVMAARQKKLQAKHGNKFNFTVDDALYT